MMILNSTMVKGKQYGIEDVRGFKTLKDFNMPVGFYGGRVDKIAPTETPGVYLLVEDMNVIDVMIMESEYKQEEVIEEEVIEEEVIEEEVIEEEVIEEEVIEEAKTAPKKTTKK